MFRKLTLAALAALAAATVGAETLSDPMRPWQASPAQNVSPSSSLRFELSAILFSPLRRVAVINGRSVSEGDRIGNAKVSRIRRRSLELEIDGTIHTVALAGARAKISGSTK